MIKFWIYFCHNVNILKILKIRIFHHKTYVQSHHILQQAYWFRRDHRMCHVRTKVLTQQASKYFCKKHLWTQIGGKIIYPTCWSSSSFYQFWLYMLQDQLVLLPVLFWNSHTLCQMLNTEFIIFRRDKFWLIFRQNFDF